MDVVSSSDSLLEVTKKMAAGQHRLAVVDNNVLTNIISQSDLIRFLTTKYITHSSITEQGTPYQQQDWKTPQPVGTFSTRSRKCEMGCAHGRCNSIYEGLQS